MNPYLFSAPERDSSGNGQDARILRERQFAIDQRQDNSSGGGRRFGSSRALVQIFDDGAMPTSNDHFFAAHPVQLNGTESEGGASTPVVDTSTTYLVDVIGTTVPSAGDQLVAYAVGGRWVAERGSGQQASGCCLSAPCGPCRIPLKDLSLTWKNVITGDGSATLTYAQTFANWTRGCGPDGLMYSLSCIGGGPAFTITYYISGACPTGQSQQCSSPGVQPKKLELISYTCQPFSMTFQATGDDCPAVTSGGLFQWTIADPDPAPDPPGLVCTTLCNPCPCFFGILDVTIANTAGDIVASGSVGSSCLYLVWPGSPGSYQITISGGEIDTFTGTLTVACNGGSNFLSLTQQLQPTTQDLTLSYTSADPALFASGTLALAWSGPSRGYLAQVPEDIRTTLFWTPQSEFSLICDAEGDVAFTVACTSGLNELNPCGCSWNTGGGGTSAPTSWSCDPVNILVTGAQLTQFPCTLGFTPISGLFSALAVTS